MRCGEARIKKFIVTAVIDGRSAGWPFGRLDVSKDLLRVRAWALPWVKKRQASANTIVRITCERSFFGLPVLRIEDTEGNFSKVRVDLPMTGNRILNELRDCGYSVDAFDRWLKLRAPWYKRGWSGPT